MATFRYRAIPRSGVSQSQVDDLLGLMLRRKQLKFSFPVSECSYANSVLTVKTNASEQQVHAALESTVQHSDYIQGWLRA